MKKKELLELQSIVRKYNREHSNREVVFQTPEHVSRNNYVVRLKTAKIFTSVFLNDIKAFIKFDEYNMYIAHYQGFLYLRIS